MVTNSDFKPLVVRMLLVFFQSLTVKTLGSNKKISSRGDILAFLTDKGVLKVFDRSKPFG